jgi:hypothetical protein
MLTRNLYNLENDGINQVNQMFQTCPGLHGFCLEKQTLIWPVTTKGNLVKVLVIPRISTRAAIQRAHTVMDRNFVYLWCRHNCN